MKITKSGKVIPFTCGSCGCEFLAGKNSVRGDNDGNYYVECPVCADECYAGIIDVQKYEQQQSLIRKGDKIMEFVDELSTEQPKTVPEELKQKMWNALYAEEDKCEKEFVGTDEHDPWFNTYRPWLQRGFDIAIKVIADWEGR